MDMLCAVIAVAAVVQLVDMAAIDPELKKSNNYETIQNRIFDWFNPGPPPLPPFIPPPPYLPPPSPCAPMLYYDEAQDHADTDHATEVEDRDYNYPIGPLPPCPPLPYYDDPEVKAEDNTKGSEESTKSANAEANIKKNVTTELNTTT